MFGVEARPREDRRDLRRPDGHLQRQALAGDAGGVRREARVQRGPSRVGEERVLPHLLREEALGEPRHEDDVEVEALHLIDGGHEEAAIPASARRVGELR